MRKKLNKIIAALGYELVRTKVPRLFDPDIRQEFSKSLGLEAASYDGGSQNNANYERKMLVFLVIGRSLLPLLENSLLSLSKAGCKLPKTIFFSPEGLRPELTLLVSRFGIELRHLEHTTSSLEYANFGSRGFNSATQAKWKIIEILLEEGNQCVIYSDCDIAYKRSVKDFVERVAAVYPCGFQSEGKACYPPVFCTGFMFFTKASIDFLRCILRLSKDAENFGNDQDLLNEVIVRNPSLARFIYLFPESLFQNGMFRDVGNTDFPDYFLFHANYSVGIESKVGLLKSRGLWFPDGAAPP